MYRLGIIVFTLLALAVMKLEEAEAAGICIRQKLDIVFMMDESSSIYPRQFHQQKEFIKQVIDEFKVGPDDTQVGLLTFGYNVRVRFSLRTFKRKDHVMRGIDYVRQRGGDTDTAEALRVLRTYCFDDYHGSRAKSSAGAVRQVAVIITDGLSMDNGRTLEEAKKCKDQGIVMITIGIGQKIKFEELEDLSSRKDYVFAVDDYDELASLVGRIGPKACIAPQDQPQGPGGRPSSIGAAGPGGGVVVGLLPPAAMPPRPLAVLDSRTGALNVRGCHDKVIDIFFVLDVSVGYFDIRRLLSFVAAVVYPMNVNGSKTRIGLMTYSTNVHIYFELNEKLNKNEVIEALRPVERDPKRYRYPSANSEEALKATRVHLFNQKYGARKFAAKAVVMVTDEPFVNPNGTIHEARKLRKLGATVFMFGVGGRVKSKDLNEVVGLDTPEYMFQSPTYKTLSRSRTLLNNMLCKVQAALGYEMDSCDKPNPVDLVFILDESSSIPYTSFMEEKDFMKKVVGKFDVGPKGSRVGLISYASNASIQFYLDTHKTKAGVVKGVNDLWRKGGDTSTWQALRILRMFGFRDGTARLRRKRRRRHGKKPQIGIVITDGQSQRPWETAREALKAQKAGIVMLAVGIGSNISFDELHSIASSDDFVLTVDDFHKLRDIVDLVGILMCKVSHHRLKLPTPTPPLDLKKETYKKGVDIVFVMDTKNAGQMDTTKVAQFAKMIVERFHIGPDGLQVSVIPCGWTSIPSFNLNTYDTREKVMEKLEMNMELDLTTLLSRVADQSFSQDHGARPRGRARRIVVIITDENQPTLDGLTLQSARIRELGAHVYVIGIGKMVRRRQLEMISGDPIGHYLIMLPNYKQLVTDKSIYRHISHAIYKGLHDLPPITLKAKRR